MMERIGYAMAQETKPCPHCGKTMIRTPTGAVLTSYPPQTPMMWWCACGHTEDAGVERGKTIQERRLEEWQRANEAS